MWAGDFNWLAILVSGLAVMVIGSAWYGAFSKPWMEAAGISAQKEELKKGSAKMYMYTFLLALITAIIMTRLINMADIEGLGQGLTLGFLLWLGFVWPVMIVNNMFQGKSKKLIFIDGGNQLLNLLAIGLILSAWR